MALATKFQGDGRSDCARRIDDAIAGGSTGTEILVRLDAALVAITAAGIDRADKRRIRRLRRAIRRDMRI
jgi:hypothetical protein